MGSTMDPAARGVHSALHTDPGLGMWGNGFCFNLSLSINIVCSLLEARNTTTTQTG